MGCRVHVGHDREGRRCELGGRKCRVERCLSGLHERCVESTAYLQGYYSLGPSFERSHARVLHTLQCACYHDLPGRVVVCDPRALDVPASLGDAFEFETEHGGHGAGVRLGGRLHCLASCLDERGALGSAQGTGGDERCVFAKAVPGDGGQLLGARAVAERPFCGCVERHKAERVGRQLGVSRRAESVGARVKQQFGEVPAHYLAQLADELPRRVVAPGDPHAGALRTLTWEDEDDHEPRMLRL